MKNTVKRERKFGTCLCGLRVDYHYTNDTNCRLTCDEAKASHPRATVKTISLLRMLSLS